MRFSLFVLRYVMQVNELKSIISRFHIRPNKILGQNFLLSEEVLDQIVAAAQLSRADTVLEIGPGLGFLTKRLAERAGKVVAIEKDRSLVRVLRKIFFTPSSSPPYQGGEKAGVVKIIQGDALFFDTYNLQPTTYKLIANIPYYLTGKILEKFLTGGSLKASVTKADKSARYKNVAEGFSPPSLLVLLLQKEVAERIVAKPGQMSILSVSVQFYSDPEIIAHVGKENFYPVPEVDSAIVRLTPPSLPPHQGEGKGKKEFLPLEGGGKEGVREWAHGFRPRFDVDERKFFQLVKIGFANKRKQLQNNLAAGLPAATPEKSGVHSYPLDSRALIAVEGELRGNDKAKMNYKILLKDLGLNPLCRAQDLSLEDWKKLYAALFDIRGRFVL